MAMEEEFDMGEAGEDELTGLKTVGDAVNYVASKLK
jgi:acyl carrier protein